MDGLIHRFRQHVEQRPTSVAVQDDSLTLNFQQLDLWSNLLAHKIALRSTNPSEKVVVCIPRSTLLLVSILAVVKAGFAYVPLDPSAPLARVEDQVSQCDAQLLLVASGLTGDHLSEVFNRPIALDIASIVTTSSVNEHERPFSLATNIDNTALLAVIFTSGSTGRPKGVLIEHASMINLVDGPTLEIQPGDRVALTANPSFDAASFEIWNSLVHGGTIFILTAHLADTDAVAVFFREKQIQKAFLPTAVFHRLFGDANVAASLNATLRMINIGGEKLSTTVAKTFLRHAPDVRLKNGYGSTETTVCATIFEVTREALQFDDDIDMPIPIGCSIPNTRFFLLDEDLHPVDFGHEGEICISGAALARGYLDASKVSSSKFTSVTGLEGSTEITRIYRTGDIGKLVSSPSGPMLFYVGRNDNQIKIRGQRLEPGEIEAVLCSKNDSVGEAAVIVTEDEKMIAFVVKKNMPDTGASNDATKLAVNQEAWDAFHAQYDWENIDPSRIGADFTGWVSMYDGVQIPLPAMEDWLADTLDGIPVKPDDSVLEIGCGTGMILFSIESRCKHYIGIDMSGPSLAFVQSQIARRDLASKVQTIQGMADQLADLLPIETRVDMVILNSVVQYFPSRDYLENVLRHCVDKLNDGGRIFLGDLRALGLDMHHDLARILHCDPSPDLSVTEIKERLELWEKQQNEFKTNPSFFFQLQEKLGGRISHVEILPKMMTTENELSQFRYQVILHIGPQPTLVAPTQWIQFSTISGLKHLLAVCNDQILAVGDIPNSFVCRQEVMLQLLRNDRPPLTALELTEAAAASKWCSQALSPHEIRSLGAQYGWHVTLSWKSLGVTRTLAVVFSRDPTIKPKFGGENLDSQPTNQPVNASPVKSSSDDDRLLATTLRELCRNQLPTYMVPDHVLIKDALPLTSNGKVDRRLLAQRSTWAQDVDSNDQMVGACQPMDDTQARVQLCVGEVLEVEFNKIPLEKDFIELGLHSFRAPKLLVALRSEFQLEVLPYATVYKYPNVAALSAHLDQQLMCKSNGNEGSISSLPTGSRKRRQVEYDQGALDKVLQIRSLSMSDVDDVYETTGIQRFCLKDSRPSIYMIHQLYIALTDVDTLIHALDTILSRQTILRTTMFDNNKYQVVFRYSPSLRDEIITVHAAEDARTIQDVLNAGHHVFSPPENLVHFDVYKTTPVTVLYHVQHALLDAWSRTYFFTEIENIIAGLSLPKAVPFRNFVDYVVTENHRTASATWFADHYSNLDAIPFPASGEVSSFTTSSVLGQNLEREERVPDLMKIPQEYGIQSATLMKIAMAVVMRNETKKDTVAFGQIYLCRNAAVEGITQICGPTFNYLIDSVDFRPGETVLELLRRTQLIQHEMVDRSFVDLDAVQDAVDVDLGPFLRFSWSSRSEEELASETLLQAGPLGLKSDLAVDWTTVIDNEQVKILVDYDPLFSERMVSYADKFYRAARWLVANIGARCLDDMHLDDNVKVVG